MSEDLHDRAQTLLTLATRHYFKGDYTAARDAAAALKAVFIDLGCTDPTLSPGAALAKRQPLGEQLLPHRRR